MQILKGKISLIPNAAWTEANSFLTTNKKRKTHLLFVFDLKIVQKDETLL